MKKDAWQEKGRGHRERLRNRFTENGIDGFTDAEVIELLLTFGTPRTDCKQQAKDLMSTFGSFPAVLEATPESLMEVKGVGAKNSFALQFIQAVSRRYLKGRLTGKRYLNSSKDVRDYLLHSMRGLKKEVLTVIYLDSSHAIIDSEVIAEGTINVNTIYPRELVVSALQRNAAALIIAHNHPSGSTEPSKVDLQLTNNLFITCKLMQIRLLDHLIIGDGVYSFADEGKMRQVQLNSDEVMRKML